MSFLSKIKCKIGLHDYVVVDAKINSNKVKHVLLKCEQCGKVFHFKEISGKLFGPWQVADKIDNWEEL